MEEAAGGTLSASCLEPLRLQEAVGLEECEPGEGPLICFETTGAEEVQERNAGGASKSVNNAHVTEQVDAVLNKEVMTTRL